MSTEEMIIAMLCTVDDPIGSVKKVPQATLHPGEVLTIGLLFAVKGGHFRAFYGCLKRDYARLFGGLADRTTSGRPLVEQQALCDGRSATPRVLNVLDSYPVELLFSIREGRLRPTNG